MSRNPDVDYFLTGDTISSSTLVVSFVVPQDEWIIQTILGALEGLANEDAWEQYGSVTTAQAAALFEQIAGSLTTT